MESIPYIVTSMVGQEVTKVDAQIACNIIIDILEVLKSVHDHHYVHNDIHPKAIVKVDDKFRLVDFGRAVHVYDKRDTAPSDWPKCPIMFASHNYEKYPGAADDLEALCYTVAYMHNKNREYWRVALRNPLEALHKRAIITNIQYLFSNLPRVFQDFFCYVYRLDIATTPDYGYWRKQFMSTASSLS
jgi:serine/threonine protein kinase